MEEVTVGEEGRYVDSEGREKIVPEQRALYLFGSQFAGLLSATELMRQVGELTDSTFEEVLESQHKYETAADALAPFKLILDLWTSGYFGNSEAQEFLTRGGDVETFLKGNGRAPEKIRELRSDTENLALARHLFHWELEFPEVFYDSAREKENPGFDGIVGNPPWGAALESTEKKYIYENYPATAKNFDTYVAMIERDVGLLRHGGILGYITPDAWLTGVSYIPIRKMLLTNGALIDLVKLPYDVFPDAYVDTVTIVFEKHEKSDDPQFGQVGILNFGKREHVSDISSHVSRRVNLDYSIWGKDPYLAFRVSLSPTDYLLEARVNQNALPLGDVVKVDRGLEAYSKFRLSKEDIQRRIYHAASKLDSSYIKQFSGELRRYVLVDENELWVKWGPHLAEYPDLEFFEKPRVLLRRLISRQFRLMAMYSEAKFANDSSTFNLIAENREYSLLFLLAILNSRLLSYFQVKRSQLAQRDDFPKLSLEEARNFPIRRVEFTTERKVRRSLVDKGKSLYDRCLAKNDLLCVTGFVDQCLKQKPEQADVVHDLLAFLAERMIEMNREKQAETKGFLEWLESAVGAKLDDLKNKTKIRTYHDGSLDDLLEVLKENSKALKKNPSSKDFYDVLKDAFQESIAKLSPLKSKLANTDRLIDLIIYRLYGLTAQEVKVVEGDQAQK